MPNQPQKLQELAEALLFRYRYLIISLVFGLSLLGFGAAILGSNLFEETKVEVLGSTEVGEMGEIREIRVEIAGEVQTPGVFEVSEGDRVEELLIKSGGLSASADRSWVEKNLNRAQKLVDGQKIYIPRLGEATKSTESMASTGGMGTKAGDKININSASLKELDSLAGIGAVRAQAIIDNRPYATTQDLVSKKIIPKSVFEDIKEEIIAQ